MSVEGLRFDGDTLALAQRLSSGVAATVMHAEADVVADVVREEGLHRLSLISTGCGTQQEDILIFPYTTRGINADGVELLSKAALGDFMDLIQR